MMSTSMSRFSNTPEQKAPAASLRQIYLLEKRNSKSAAELCAMKPEGRASKCTRRCSWRKGAFYSIRSIKENIINAMLCFQSLYFVLLPTWQPG